MSFANAASFAYPTWTKGDQTGTVRASIRGVLVVAIEGIDEQKKERTKDLCSRLNDSGFKAVDMSSPATELRTANPIYDIPQLPLLLGSMLKVSIARKSGDAKSVILFNAIPERFVTPFCTGSGKGVLLCGAVSAALKPLETLARPDLLLYLRNEKEESPNRVKEMKKKAIEKLIEGAYTGAISVDSSKGFEEVQKQMQGLILLRLRR